MTGGIDFKDKVINLGAMPVTNGAEIEAAVTVSEMFAVEVRACASLIVATRVFVPADVATGTLAANEKILSPAAASPFVASSKNVCDDDPSSSAPSSRHYSRLSSV